MHFPVTCRPKREAAEAAPVSLILARLGTGLALQPLTQPAINVVIYTLEVNSFLWDAHRVVSKAGCFKCEYPTRSCVQSTDGA
jgi:hypothetical protein